MKKIFNLFIFLIGFSFYTYSYAEKNLEQDSYPSSAIWKIQIDRVGGTGFFISPNLFVTNFHIVAYRDFFDLKRTSLSQETHSRVLGIKRVYALSALDDLAILETKESVTNWLDIADNTPKPYEKLFSIGYPGEHWAKVRKTGNISYQNKYIYSFPFNHIYLGGSSGSPVLNQENQIVGIFFSSTSNSNSNTAYVIKVKRLKKLLVENSQYTNLTYESMKKKAIQKLKSLAKKEPFAQYQLAWMYYSGIGVEQNFEKAFYWFQKSAEQGFALAQFKLAWMYQEGEGVEQNLEQAVYWYKKVAEQGNADAQFNLAMMYLTGGIGVEQNFEKGFYWLKKSAEQGNTNAQYNLAVVYLTDGIGVEQNLDKGFYWLKKSAEQGIPPALYNLAVVYLTGGIGVEQNLDKGFYWLKKSAEQGNADAQNKLAEMYDNGTGVEQNFKKASLQGIFENLEGKTLLEKANLDLPTLKKTTLKKAVYQNKKVTEQGNADAQKNLKEMYYDGIGVQIGF